MKFNKLSLERTSLAGCSFSMLKGGFMKKVITFTEDQIQQIIWLLNGISVTGIQNSRQIATIAQILDTGMPGEINEPERKEKFKDVYSPIDLDNPHERKTTISNEKKKEGAS
jgi:hypothetical protein